jgi:hypothetical protein
MKKSCILLSVILLSACSAKLIAPAQSDVDRVSTKYPGYTLGDLNAGKDLYQHTCNRCHFLHNPHSRTEAKWEEIVPTMINRLNRREGKEAIDSHQQDLILRYLVTMSAPPKP